MAKVDEKPSVRVTSEEVSPVVRSLGVEVDASRVSRAFERAYRELAKKVRVRGFRPGKTPRSVLERLYGASVAEDVERTLVAQTLPGALLALVGGELLLRDLLVEALRELGEGGLGALHRPRAEHDVVSGLGERAVLHWLDTANHSYTVLKRTRADPRSVFEEMGDVASAFVGRVPA